MRPVASEGHSDTSASTLIAATSADAIPEPDLTEAELPAIEAAAETPEADAVREAIAEPDDAEDAASEAAPAAEAEPEAPETPLAETPVTETVAEAAPEPQAPEIPEPQAVETAEAAPEEPASVPAEIPLPAAEQAPEKAAEKAAEEIPAAVAVMQDGLAQAATAAATAAPAYRFGFTPVYFDVQGMGSILIAYMQSESAAAMSHMRALGEARSPADMIRLQVTEMQRVADASLTCWVALARSASRPAALH